MKWIQLTHIKLPDKTCKIAVLEIVWKDIFCKNYRIMDSKCCPCLKINNCIKITLIIEKLEKFYTLYKTCFCSSKKISDEHILNVIPRGMV